LLEELEIRVAESSLRLCLDSCPVLWTWWMLMYSFASARFPISAIFSFWLFLIEV